MPDRKLTQLPIKTSVQTTDMLYLVRNPTSAPESVAMTAETLRDWICDYCGGSIADGGGDGDGDGDGDGGGTPACDLTAWFTALALTADVNALEATADPAEDGAKTERAGRRSLRK